jgi:hypothetical protein
MGDDIFEEGMSNITTEAVEIISQEYGGKAKRKR